MSAKFVSYSFRYTYSFNSTQKIIDTTINFDNCVMHGFDNITENKDILDMQLFIHQLYPERVEIKIINWKDL